MKKFFSMKLYKEGLRQTKLAGLTYLGLTILITLLGYTDLSCDVNGMLNVRYFDPVDELVGFMFGYVVIAPLLCLSLFHFLNKRSASDFYHSLPQSRTSLFVSFFLVIQTWLTAPVIIGLISSAVKFTIIPGSHGSFWAFVLFAVSLLSCNMLVSSAVILAMTLASTLFSQLAVSGLIIFLPRTLMIVFYELVSEKNVLIPDLYSAGGLFGNVFGNSYNLVFSSTFGILFSGGEFGDSISAVIYTLILSLVYLTIAWLLFNRRKSETAATSASNEFVQTCVRTLIAFVICIPCCVILCSDIGGEGPILIFLYILSVTAYFVYELITRKTLRGFTKKMLPGLAALVILNIAFVVGVNITSYLISNVDTSAENIKSVNYANSGYYYNNEYHYMLGRDALITDKAFIEICSESLENTKLKERYQISEPATFDITLKNGVTIRRRIDFGFNRREASKLLYNNDELFNEIFEMPDSDKIISVNSSYVTDEQAMEIYTTLRNEYEDLSKREKSFIMQDHIYAILIDDSIYRYSDDYATIGYIDVNVFYDGKNTSARYPISTATPETAQKYIDFCNDNNRYSFEELEKRAKRGNFYNVSVTMFKNNISYNFDVPYEMLEGNDICGYTLSEVLGEISDGGKVDLSENKPYCCIYYDSFIDAGGYQLFVSVKDPDAFISLANMINDEVYKEY